MTTNGWRPWTPTASVTRLLDYANLWLGLAANRSTPSRRKQARSTSEVRQGHTYGVLALTLQPDDYSWRFVPEAGATFKDEGSSDCHEGMTHYESRSLTSWMQGLERRSRLGTVTWLGTVDRECSTTWPLRITMHAFRLAGFVGNPERNEKPISERPDDATI